MKPFNPLLGETFQGRFPDGARVYVEHTRHNPPTDNFFIKAENYVVTGYYELEGSMNTNSVDGFIRGPTKVMFRDGHTIRFTMPKFILGGTLWGSRTLHWEGSFEFDCNRTGHVATVKIGVNKSGWNPYKIKVTKDTLLGKIYIPEQGRRDRIKEEHGHFYGSWLESLTFKNNS